VTQVEQELQEIGQQETASSHRRPVSGDWYAAAMSILMSAPYVSKVSTVWIPVTGHASCPDGAQGQF